jgi:hypothetical protein
VIESTRVWRVRKDHTWIDARVRDAGDGAGIELLFFYDGTMVFARHCPSRDAAFADADTYLKDLQRAGWNTHW